MNPYLISLVPPPQTRYLCRALSLLLGIAMAYATPPTNAEADFENLVRAMEADEVALMEVTGTGGATGHVLEGYLVNKTSTTKKLDVQLDLPLFLLNSGSGQNMVATQIFEKGGGYYIAPENDGRPFIHLKPKEKLPISLFAYCVDFGKDNPSRNDLLTVGKLPTFLTEIMSRISAYEELPPDTSTMKGAQAALWSVQGVDLDEIKKKFKLDAADEAKMREILPASR